MNHEATQDLVTAVRALDPDRRQTLNLGLLNAAPLVDLELSSACNVQCVFCPRQEVVRSERLMTSNTFAAVEDFLPRGAVIMLSGMGEGLLHERVAEWVGRLTARGHSTCLITNGILLSPDRQQQLIEAGIAQFQVSVHGLDAQTVETVIRNRFGSEVVRANLDHLARNRPAHLRVRINFVETATNSNARPMVEEFARERDFEFFYRREHSRAGAHGPGASARLNEGCGIFASVTFVSCDGEVLPCVNDVRGRSGLGNVRNLRWADVERWKQRVIRDSCWFGDCAVCDDDYRWVLMGQGGLDERAPERLSRSRSTGVAGRLEGAEER